MLTPLSSCEAGQAKFLPPHQAFKTLLVMAVHYGAPFYDPIWTAAQALRAFEVFSGQPQFNRIIPASCNHSLIDFSIP